MDFCNSCILTFILTIMCFCNPVSKAFNFLLCLEATLAKIWRSSSVESTSSWHLVKNGLMIGFSQHAQSESLALCKNLMIYLMCFLCCIFYFFLFPFQVWAPHFAPLQYWILGGTFPMTQNPLLKAGCSKGRGNCLVCLDLLFVFIHLFQDPKKAACTVFTSYTGILYTSDFINVGSVCYLTVY